jgi:S-adenosylmethionine-dependent methyltransferase
MMSDSERFQTGADKYAAYLETPEGRLRLDLTFYNLRDFLPHPSPPSCLRVLDIGGGTGITALRLAQLGLHVTLLDSSLPMLELASRAANEAGVAKKIELKHGDASQLSNVFPAESFDVILCHNVLEFVYDPIAVLTSAARAMRNSSAILSILVRSHAGEVLKTAISGGDLAAAEHTLTVEWGDESLYGGKVRLFTPDSLHAMLGAASLTVIAERGVRVVSDYLPPQISRTDQYERILALELELGRRPEFAAVARYSHCLTRCSGSLLEVGG